MLIRLRSLTKSQSGQGALPVLITVVAVVIMGYLLARTMNAAVSINKKADTIEKTGSGINTATKVIANLNKTEAIGTSILTTSKPLVPQLTEIDRLGKSIDGLATTINGNATTILGTIRGVNAEASDILDSTKQILGNVNTISGTLDTIRGVISAVQGDTGAIVPYLRTVHHNANQLDKTLAGGGDSH